MRRDTLSGFLFILVGDNNDIFSNEISNISSVSKLIIDTDIKPTQELVNLERYRFVSSKLFNEKYFSADYLFKWESSVSNGSCGINKNHVYNVLRKGEVLVCSLNFEIVKDFIYLRQVPKKNYILINVSLDKKVPKGFDEFSFDYYCSDITEIITIVKRHI